MKKHYGREDIDRRGHVPKMNSEAERLGLILFPGTVNEA